jgi:hypothetical protein
MIRIQSLAPLLLTLLLGSTALVAQETDPQESAPKDEAPATAEPAAKPATPAPAANDDSPFDYRSSEEISEDLSVSFPVDI